MKNLENYGLVELNSSEVLIIGGGSILTGINPLKIIETLGKIADAIAIADAVDRFMDGFNSVHCKH